MRVIRDLNDYKLALHNAGKPFNERLFKICAKPGMESKLLYLYMPTALMLLVGGVASFVFGGMILAHTPLFASMDKLLHKWTACMLLPAGFVLSCIGILGVSGIWSHKITLKKIKDISLEDPNKRLLALAGNPEERHSEVTPVWGRIERDPDHNSVVHYALDMKVSATTHDLEAFRTPIKIADSPTDTDFLHPTLSQHPHAQLIVQQGDNLTCVNYGDNVAFLIRIENGKRRFILLSEPQSNNPYFRKKQVVITQTKWKAGDELVIGARIAPARLLQTVMDQSKKCGSIDYGYSYEIDAIVDWAQGQKIVL